MGEDLRTAVVLGAGPSGLACALELAKYGTRVTVLERSQFVGGLARTEEFKGHKFDVGPHRFFTKSDEVMRLWVDLLGDEFREVKRLTRIFYRGKYFLYPVSLQDALPKLGPIGSIKAALSYAAGKIGAPREPATFEEWAVKAFGRELYRAFFKTYTEKVWGIPCSEIGAEWAAQRIKNVNAWSVIMHAIRRNDKSVKSLVESFHYPRQGAGMMYEAMRDRICASGGEVITGATVVEILRDGDSVTGVVAESEGRRQRFVADQYFSSIPITAFVNVLSPGAPQNVRHAAQQLRYRGHITANLIVRGKQLFPDNWIYVHSPDVKMARLANYNNFSDEMSPGDETSALSVEYFAFPEELIWQMSDEDILQLAADELHYMGLITRDLYVDGYVIKEEDAYPVYYMGHRPHFDAVKEFARSFKNMRLIGRGGQYRYDNQDHAMLTGLLAARAANGQALDFWAVNEEEEYHEEVSVSRNLGGAL